MIIPSLLDRKEHDGGQNSLSSSFFSALLLTFCNLLLGSPLVLPKRSSWHTQTSSIAAKKRPSYPPHVWKGTSCRTKASVSSGPHPAPPRSYLESGQKGSCFTYSRITFFSGEAEVQTEESSISRNFFATKRSVVARRGGTFLPHKSQYPTQ